MEFPQILNDAIPVEFVKLESLEREEMYKKALAEIAITMIVAMAIALKLPSAVLHPSKHDAVLYGV